MQKLPILIALLVAAPAFAQTVHIAGDARDYTIRADVDGDGLPFGPDPFTILPGSGGAVDLDITADPGFDLASRKAIFMFDLSPLLTEGGPQVAAATLRVSLVDVDLTTTAPTDFTMTDDLRDGPTVDVSQWTDPAYQTIASDVFDGAIQDQPVQDYFIDVTDEVTALYAALQLDPTRPFVHVRGEAGNPATLLFMEIGSGDASPDQVPLLSVRFVPEPATAALLTLPAVGLLRNRRRAAAVR